MRNHDFIKGFIAGGVIAANRIVKFDDKDTEVVQASAATDSMIGVATLGALATGDSVSVVMGGVAQIEYGGNITRGALVTSDSSGKAVAAAPAAGVNNRIVGVAMMSGVSGDLGSVLVVPVGTQGAGLA